MVHAPSTTADEVRRTNLRAVLWLIHTEGPTERSALTRELGLNRSTIGDLTAELTTLGLVHEELPRQRERSGRPSHIVVPSREVTVLAVEVDVDRLVVALVSLGGRVHSRVVENRIHRSRGVRAVVAATAKLCTAALRAAPEVRCVGVGVSVPGVIRAEDGMVRFAPNLGWVDEPFTAMLHDALLLPVQTGNDANLGVFAEHLRGAAVGVDDVVYLRGDVGVGGGFLVGGVPLRGHGGYAGEIGHLVMDTGGRPCRCGARGCWETLVGENVLLEAAGRPAGGGAAEVADVILAADVDRLAGAALDEFARWMGVGLRAIVNLLNPQTIVLGGVLAQVWAVRRREVMEPLRQSALEAPEEDLQILAAGLGSDSCLMGAAELAFADLLADPQTHARLPEPAALSAPA